MRTSLKFQGPRRGTRSSTTTSFDLRVMLGCDVLLSVDSKDDKIEDGDRRRLSGGSWGMDAGIGFDMGYFTVCELRPEPRL